MKGPLRKRDRVRISPLDMTAERDGVSVSMGRDTLLTLELFVHSPGRIVRPKDILVRIAGRHYHAASKKQTAPNAVNRARKAAAPLGLTIETVAGGWQMREGG